jgi:outer membrane protein OmpA-like peptidoglycan-associated protein
MKKQLSILLLAIVLLPACKSNKKQKAKDLRPAMTSAQVARVDLPLAGDDLRNFFDEGVDEFAFVDENDLSQLVSVDTQDSVDGQLAWVNHEDDAAQPIYFDFDKYAVRDDQESVVKEDIQYAKKELKKNDLEQTAVVVEGHSCHSAGSAVYNLALSNKRAKVVSDRFKAEGLAVKTVGRGAEMPALVHGKVVTGGREEQSLNRRVEVKVLHG